MIVLVAFTNFGGCAGEVSRNLLSSWP